MAFTLETSTMGSREPLDFTSTDGVTTLSGWGCQNRPNNYYILLTFWRKVNVTFVIDYIDYLDM